MSTTLLLLALSHLTTAHFGITYPEWRATTLGTGHNYSQWTYPCAGVPGDLENGNRTDWPLTGGSVVLDLHHDWTYVFINLGLGPNTTVFNYTLTPEFYNITGEGTYCFPKIEVPASLNITDGTEGSLQVVTVGDSGSALYNCADITFKTDAQVLSGDECKSSEGMVAVKITEQKEDTGGDTGGGTSAASSTGMSSVVLTAVVGLTMVFAAGMSL